MIISVFNSMKIFRNHKIVNFFLKYIGKTVGAGTRAGVKIFDKLEPEPEPHTIDRLRNTANTDKILKRPPKFHEIIVRFLCAWKGGM
jgi:hypothetical protein